MSEFREARSAKSPPPDAYIQFVEDAREFVTKKGLSWRQDVNEQGEIPKLQQWDLRELTDSFARTASRITGFRVSELDRQKALTTGWNPLLVPQGGALAPEAQEFIKAITADRCRDKILPKVTRHLNRLLSRLFSVTGVLPWELSSDDVNRFIQLTGNHPEIADKIRPLSTVINRNALSVNAPITIELPSRFRTGLTGTLEQRDGGEKLPDRDSFYEIIRIIFHEVPLSHIDVIRFAVLRVMIFTGLRINEVLMLRHDCLVWVDILDVVSERPAGECGGVSRSLRLRYFAEKHEEFAPDHLVEEMQWVPARFQDAVAEAIKIAQDATMNLRRVLADQHARNRGGRKSDLRTFKTSAGGALTTADLLFLVIHGSRGDLPKKLESLSNIAPISSVSMYNSIGGSPRTSLFDRYRKGESVKHLSIRPHSLRHLLNTELFRLEVSDTIITEHFGRKSVIQSYEYDHRSLAEKLRFVEIPEVARGLFADGSAQEFVAQMVVSGVAAGSHLAESFRKIQAEHGDEKAFRYLVANSDGFHVTPYGFCTNSFSVNPCARHLKCFDQCKHFAASGTEEHVITLKSLKVSLVAMKAAAEAKPARSVGRKNQIAHAERMITGVTAALAAQPRAAVFPDGQDHAEDSVDLLT